MKSIKRAPLLGLIGCILLIIITLISMISVRQLKKECVELKNINEELNTTVQTLKDENIELQEKISELEEQISINLSSRIVKGRTTSRSQESREHYASLDDRETLARLVFLEANTESLECQKAIVSVIINRVNSGYWGNTVNSVVYAKNQFTPASRIPYTTPTDINYEAVDYVLENGVTLPSYVLYFRANYHFNWFGYVPYTSMGSTYFGYMTKDVDK